MASDQFNELLGRALIDDDFRTRLLDPKKRVAALKEITGKKPTKAQTEALNNAVTALQSLHGSLGQGVGAA